MANAQNLQVQVTQYNKKYEMDLSTYDKLKIEFSNSVEKEIFEKILVCKMYGITYKMVESDNVVTGIEYDFYSEVTYKIFYGYGNDTKGDVSKCLFGFVHDFVAKGKTTETGVVPDISIPDPYLFIFAHRTGSNDGVPDENMLRAHKVIVSDNLKFFEGLSYESPCYGLGVEKENGQGAQVILGFSRNKERTYWEFYLPQYSYCLEGRSENIINLGENYQGTFKVVLPPTPSS